MAHQQGYEGAQTQQQSKVSNIDAYCQMLRADERLTPAVREAVAFAKEVIAKTDIIFYVAGALTGVDDETKQRYKITSELVGTHRSPGIRMFGYAPHMYGTDPLRHPGVTPAEVRDIDYLWAVITANCHINFPYPIAHGNAIEEGWAEEAGIPSVYVIPKRVKLSRLTLGMRNIIGTINYEVFDKEGVSQLKDFLGAMNDSFHIPRQEEWVKPQSAHS
jgi:hypothetical protein